MDAKERIVVCEMWLAGILLVHESRAESSQAAPSAANIVKVLLPFSKTPYARHKYPQQTLFRLLGSMRRRLRGIPAIITRAWNSNEISPNVRVLHRSMYS